MRVDYRYLGVMGWHGMDGDGDRLQVVDRFENSSRWMGLKKKRWIGSEIA
jgi:hypothetical protein